jgi:glycine cleavage system H lipoate-binding protein
MIVGAVLLLVVAFPLILVLFVTMRFVLAGGAVVALLGTGLAYAFSPTVRAWFKIQNEQQFSYNGLRLATNIAVHPSHSWARIGRDDVAVGADDFVQATLGPVEAVDLPPVGSWIEQGRRAFGLRRGNRKVDVRAPISGTVVACNEALLARPQLVNEEPFARGWAVRLQSDSVHEDRRSLLRGRRARSWFREEVDRLIGTALSEDALMPTLPDGGALVNELHLQIDDEAWKKLREISFEVDAPKQTERS